MSFLNKKPKETKQEFTTKTKLKSVSKTEIRKLHVTRKLVLRDTRKKTPKVVEIFLKKKNLKTKQKANKPYRRKFRVRSRKKYRKVSERKLYRTLVYEKPKKKQKLFYNNLIGDNIVIHIQRNTMPKRPLLRKLKKLKRVVTTENVVKFNNASAKLKKLEQIFNLNPCNNKNPVTTKIIRKTTLKELGLKKQLLNKGSFRNVVKKLIYVYKENRLTEPKINKKTLNFAKKTKEIVNGNGKPKVNVVRNITKQLDKLAILKAFSKLSLAYLNRTNFAVYYKTLIKKNVDAVEILGMFYKIVHTNIKKKFLYKHDKKRLIDHLINYYIFFEFNFNKLRRVYDSKSRKQFKLFGGTTQNLKVENKKTTRIKRCLRWRKIRRRGLKRIAKKQRKLLPIVRIKRNLVL